MRKLSDIRKQSGFTLIEMIIVIAIMGLIVAGLARAGKIYIANQQRTALDKSYDIIRSALNRYVYDDPSDATDAINYPCPASPTTPPGSALYGVEIRVGADCAQQDGVIEVAGTGGQKVYIGAVPTRTLEIKSSHMVDPYKNRLTYAVSADVARTDAFLGGASVTGAISIQDHSTGNTTNTAAFALISHGSNGKGAYNMSGGLFSPCDGVGHDVENCNNDAQFSFQELSLGANAQFYDDRLAFTLVDEKDDEWWSSIDVDGSNIQNKNPGTVGIIGALEVNQDITAINNVNVAQDITAVGNITAITDMSVGQNLIVSNTIGIGVSSPSEALDVYGNARISGNIWSGGVQASGPVSASSLQVSGSINAADISSGTGDSNVNASCGDGQVLQGIINGAPKCVALPTPPEDTSTTTPTDPGDDPPIDTDCKLPWANLYIKNGQSINAYREASVDYGATCAVQSRFCNAGDLEGSFQFPNCTVGPAADCSIPWGGTVKSGEGVTAYQEATVPHGENCRSEFRMCNDGTLEGSYAEETCVNQNGAECVTPWGRRLNHGESTRAYKRAGSPFGDICDSEMRDCNNGELSGSYELKTCHTGLPSDCWDETGGDPNDPSDPIEYQCP